MPAPIARARSLPRLKSIACASAKLRIRNELIQRVRIMMNADHTPARFGTRKRLPRAFSPSRRRQETKKVLPDFRQRRACRFFVSELYTDVFTEQGN